MRVAAGEEHIARVAARYPAGRVGQVGYIVPFAAFRCGAAADHLSGTLLGIRPIIGQLAWASGFPATPSSPASRSAISRAAPG